MSPVNYVVVGLSGITCSGKSTLSIALKRHFGSDTVELLPLDEYFHTDTSKLNYIKSIQHYDYDEMSSLDWDKYHAEILAVIERFSRNQQGSARRILIVEGFLLFNETRVRDLCHLKYDFVLPYAEAKKRREERIYDPPDVPGYFDEVAWPAALKYSKEVESLKRTENIVTLDGTEPADFLLNKVVADIEQFLANR